jgi:branched-chain amino acid transport system substrate-binding protein
MIRIRRLAAGLFAAALSWFVIAPAQAAAEAIPIALIEGLSGPFANAGEAVHRNLLLAVERINARGGVKLPGGAQHRQRFLGRSLAVVALQFQRPR